MSSRGGPGRTASPRWPAPRRCWPGAPGNSAAPADLLAGDGDVAAAVVDFAQGQTLTLRILIV